MLLIIISSVVYTEQQVVQLRLQEATSSNIERSASSLSSVAIDYFLYQEDYLQLQRWNTTISSLRQDITNLKVNNQQQQKLADSVENDLENINQTFADVTSYLQNAYRTVSIRIDPEFQHRWSSMAVQNQALAFDSSQLSNSFDNQAHQANDTNTLLIVSLAITFGAFLATIYLIVFRRTLKSVTELQNGIDTIGSGNLEYVIETKRNDEVTDLSCAFNKMTANLKNLTASKADLENEIAGRKKADEAMRESEERFSKAFHNSPIPQIIARFGDWHYVDANESVANLLEYSREELIGHSSAELNLIPLVRRESGVQSVIQAGELRDFETDVRTKFGKIITVLVSTETITLNGEKHLINTFIDITMRKQMQAKLEEYSKHLEDLVKERTKQLKDAERLAAIGATAGMVGHDIRNPLQAITGDVYLAKTELAAMPESDEKKNTLESLHEIEKNIDYINKIVADLQDFARPLKPNIEEADLKLIIDELLRKNSLPENIKVAVKVESEARKIFTDCAYLNRILYNLVTNAVQAMPKGGKIYINASKDKKTGDAIITVKDTGVGIPDGAKEKMFTPMFTTKSKGQGFGLAVIKRMAEALKGNVSFVSQEGKGTKFIIQIPQKFTETIS